MQLGWIDFSKEDRAKVLDVMNLLQEQGAVDEIGIGIVRDAFANYFFPGTSTIQTRAKYFLIVPYALRDAADGRYGSDLTKMLRKIDEDEKQCAVSLMANCPEAEGIVGKRVLPKAWVSRTPSSIYWNGIRTYGIFKDKSLSISEYLRVAAKLRRQKNSVPSGNRGEDTEDSDRDDKDAGDLTSFTFWELPYYPEKWREELDIELTAKEAAFLKTQIVRNTRGSLLAYILENHIDVDIFDSFEALTEGLKLEVPDKVREMMELACDFNMLVYMARVRYNMILSDGRNREANEEWGWIGDNLAGRAHVDLAAVFEKLNISNPRTFRFLALLKEHFQNENIDAADELIKKREIQLKGIHRAKLNKVGEYNPDVWIGGGWLDFRFSDARRIIKDIYHGEGASCV